MKYIACVLTSQRAGLQRCPWQRDHKMSSRGAPPWQVTTEQEQRGMASLSSEQRDSEKVWGGGGCRLMIAEREKTREIGRDREG